MDRLHLLASVLLPTCLLATPAFATKSYVMCKSSKVGAAAAAAALNDDLDHGVGLISRDDGGNILHLPKSEMTISTPTVYFVPADSGTADAGNFIVCVTVTGDFWDQRN